MSEMHRNWAPSSVTYTVNVPGVVDDAPITSLYKALQPSAVAPNPRPVTETEVNVPYASPATFANPSPVATVVIAPPFTPSSCKLIVTGLAIASCINNNEANPMIEKAASAALSFDFMASHPSERTAAAAASIAFTKQPVKCFLENAVADPQTHAHSA
jgi:hypothetical protein